MRCGRRRSRWIKGLLALAASTACRSAIAAVVSVDASGCPSLDAREVARLLELELSTANGAPLEQRLLVWVDCSGAAVRVVLFDPGTGLRHERLLSAVDPAVPGRERLIALAAAQILTYPPSNPVVVRVGGPPPAAPAPLSNPRRETAVGLSGGVRWRDTRSLFPLLHVALAGTFWRSPEAGVFLEAAFEGGSAHRRGGDVAVRSALVSAGGAFRSALTPHLDLDVRSWLSLVYLELAGRPGASAWKGSIIEAVTGELGVGLGPALHGRVFRVAPVLEGGVLFAAPEAGVVGEQAVSLAGAWFGARFRAELAP
jgi:hypothetical protein